MDNKIVKDKKIEVGKKYYTCSYTGVERVIIIKIFDNNKFVLVKADREDDKLKPFVRPIKYIFDTANKAKNAKRNWEHDDRKRRKKRKNKNKTNSKSS